MHNPKPLVSVIIPTFNRPQFLARAVNSALAGMDGKEVEVIVVPNGPDQSWKESLANFKNNPSVRVIPIREANANIARNTGMANARGELIRFLDDDDYLIPEGAVKQYQLMQYFGADVVSASLQIVDAKGRILDVWHQPDTDDLCCAILGPWRRCLPTAHVYRKTILSNVQWDPNTLIRQDFEWLFDLCCSQEVIWKKDYQIVGVWQHHWGERISTSKKFNEIRKLTVPMLISAHDCLEKTKRLTDLRKRAIAQGLLSCVHSSFFLEPFYWTSVIKLARSIDSSARPIQPIYHFHVLKHLNILIFQWLFLPKRWLTWKYRTFLQKMRIKYSS